MRCVYISYKLTMVLVLKMHVGGPMVTAGVPLPRPMLKRYGMMLF